MSASSTAASPQAARSQVTGMVLVGPSRLEQQAFARPMLSGDDAVLQVEATGLCGSDLARYTGSRGPLPPMILGHEIVGRIDAIDSIAARRWSVDVGDRVVIEEALPCGACDYCTNGMHRLCSRSGLRYGQTSVEVNPALWGGFAEAMYLHPLTRLHKVPKGVDAAVATLYIPVSNAYGWLLDAGQFRAGDDVVILGPGLHGLCASIVAVLIGAHSVTLVGQSGDERRLRFAERFGVRTLDIGAGRDNATAILEGLGEGADIVLDLVPGPQEGLALAIELARPAGRVVVAGVKKPQTSVSLPSMLMLQNEVTLRGVWARPSWAITRALQLLASEPRFADLIEDHYPLDRAGAALDDMQSSHRSLHGVVVPQHER